MSTRTSIMLEEVIRLYRFAGISPEQSFTEAGRHCDAPVSAAARVRNPSNLVPVPAFQSMKITASVFDKRHIAHRPLCTDQHKIKSGMHDCKYPRTGPSRGPRANSRPPKDPCDHLAEGRHRGEGRRLSTAAVATLLALTSSL